MNSGQTIALLCAQCGASVRRSLDEWTEGFACPACGQKIQRPGQAGGGGNQLPQPIAKPPTLKVLKPGHSQQGETIAEEHLVPHLEAEIDTLLHRIAELEAHTSDSARSSQLHAELEMKRAENSELREAIKEMAMEQAHNQHDLELAIVNSRQYYNQLQELTARVQDLEKERDAASRERDTIGRERDTQTRRADQLQSELDQAHKALEEARQREGDARVQAVRLKKEAETGAGERENLRKQVSALTEERETLNHKLAVSRQEQAVAAQAREEREAEANQAKIDLRLTREKLSEVMKEKVENGRRVKEQDKALAVAAEREQKLTEKIRELAVKAAEHEAKNKAILPKYGALLEAQKQWSAEKAKLEHQVAAADKQHEELAREHRELQLKLEQSTVRETESLAEMERVRKVAAEAVEAADAGIRERDELAGKLATAEQAATDAAARCSAAETARGEAVRAGEQKVVELQEQLTALEARLAEAQESENQLKQEVERVQAVQQAAEESSAQGDAASVDSRKQMATVIAERNVLREKLQQTAVRMKELATQKAIAEKKLEHAVSRESESQTSAGTDREELEALQRLADEHRLRAEKAVAEAESLRQEAEEAKLRTSAARDEVELARQAAERAEHDAETARKQAQDIEAKLKNIQDVDAADDPQKALKKQLAQLTIENKYLRQQADTADEATELKKRVVGLEAQLKARSEAAAREIHKLNAVGKLLREKLATQPPPVGNEEVEVLKIENQILREKIDKLAAAVKEQGAAPGKRVKKITPGPRPPSA